jgi:hypothetical protein
MNNAHFILWVFLPFLGACSNGSSAGGSCDYRTNQMAAKICQEWSGVPPAQRDSLKSTCQAPQTWSDATCPRTAALGGCTQVASGITATMWFYPDSANGLNSAGDVMTKCSSGQQFVSP